ncbi:MAG: PAS domain S-box protein [Verrucomicrobiia bacterium]
MKERKPAAPLRLAELLDLAREGIFVRDMAGAITLWYHGAEQMYGWTKEKAVGRVSCHLLQTKFPKPLSEIEEDLLRTGYWDGELIQTRCDGGQLVVESRWALHRDVRGRLVEILEINYDITTRKRAEAALRESEEGQRTLFESAPDPIVVVDAEGQMQRVNRRAEAMFGYQRSELIGQPVEMLIPELFRSRHERHRAGYIGSPYLRPMGAGLQLYGRRKDGTEFSVDIMLSPLEAERGTMVIAVVRDVTERKRAEEALRRLSGRLQRAQDEERRRIARELHDSTGQNLAALSMNLSLVTRSAASLDAPAQRALAECITMAEKCVQEVRTLSYLLHPPMLDEGGLTSALCWFVDGFSRRSGMRVNLEVAPDWERPTREMEVALFRVVQESLTNAHRHSESPTATIRVYRKKAAVCLEVEDDGKGMTVPTDGGWHEGVGIMGMQERIRQLGGQLDVESGRTGTTVRATLPMEKATT